MSAQDKKYSPAELKHIKVNQAAQKLEGIFNQMAVMIDLAQKILGKHDSELLEKSKLTWIPYIEMGLFENHEHVSKAQFTFEEVLHGLKADAERTKLALEQEQKENA